jgi:putative spermidine/putrescine transport system ATP-binding protein/spermidine/putrescine transport system ATP-binding protein
MDYDLELAGVRKVYPNGTVAVSNFDMKVERGEFVSFVGPSGCGKTTTLRMIAGFEEISEGEVLVRGKRINELPAEKRPTSTIFQNFALFPHMNVRENVEYGLAVKGLSRAERRARAERIMDKLDLLDIADRKEGGLSGGQRQRVALARGLVVEPDILLLDEPLGALDANLRKSIQQELKLLQRNLGVTFIFVTHAQSEALILSDRVVVMNRGNVEQISTPYELYTRPKTPFVARFIGRNTIFDGRLARSGPDGAVIETRYGPLRGTPNDAGLAEGGAASIVVPAEAIDVHPESASDDPRVAETYAGNLIHGRVAEAILVGHTVSMKVRFDDGSTLQVESHVSKYAEDLTRTDAPVLVGWSADEATVIRQGA